MKTVKTYTNLAEAGFAKSLLDAAGVPAFLAGEESYSLGYGIAAGALRLQAEDGDGTFAYKILHDPFGKRSEKEGK